MKFVYVECKADFSLIKSIMKIPKRKIYHAGCKSELCKKLEKQDDCIGLMDEDPLSVQPSYIKKMEVVSTLPQCDLTVLHESSKRNYIVILCPRLEDWIVRTAQEAGIRLEKYGFPRDPDEFHERVNSNLEKFEMLIENLTDSRRMKTLKNVLGKEISSH